MAHRLRLPVSTRHAFALAFDLAVRRDAMHSLFVPLLIQAPWLIALGVLPPIEQDERGMQVMLVWAIAQIGTFVLWLIVSAMLRFRARSVFNTPPGTAPVRIEECYARGLRRVPWLLVTEVVRNLSLLLAFSMLVIPGVFLGFRLSFATEAVVLDEQNTANAFLRSFKLTEGRFERWLEMIAVSVVLVIGCAFLVAVLAFSLPTVGINTWWAVFQLLSAALMPVIQYAWTFFYLRLVEVEHGMPYEVGPAYAGAPALALVSPQPSAEGPDPLHAGSTPSAETSGATWAPPDSTFDPRSADSDSRGAS
jgi:hypothetical protein